LLADLPLEATAFLILFARIGAVILLLPLLSEEAAPGQVRLLLAVGVTAALFGLLRPQVAGQARASDLDLMVTVLAELLSGLAIGLVIRLMFQAAAMAGAIISLQIGLTSVLTFDGQAGQIPLMAKMMALAAALICFAAGIHHLWIAAIVRSYGLFPVGTWLQAGDWLRLAVGTAGEALGLAVSMTAPFIVYAILFNLALGLGARLAPSLQLFFVAQPLNLLFGFAILAMTVSAMLALFAARFGGWLQTGPLHG